MPAYRVSSEGDFKELEKRVKKYLKYEKISDLGPSGLFMILYMILSFADYFLSKQLFNRDIQVWEILSILGFSAAISFIVIRFADKTAEKYAVEDNEWAIYYSHLMSDNLDRYFRVKRVGPKEEYRKKALKNAKDFLSCIKKRWVVGKFKLVKPIRDVVSDLKDNLQYRVIPALESGNDKEIKKISSVFYSLYYMSKNLKVDDIRKINNMIVSYIPERRPPRMKIVGRILGYLSEHKIAQHTIVMSILTLGGIVTGFILVVYLGISKDAVFSGLAAVFSALTVLYFSKQK